MGRKGKKQSNNGKGKNPDNGSIIKEDINFNPARKIKTDHQLILVSVLLVVLVFITYRNSFNNEFVDWDDYTYVVDNPLVRNPHKTTLKDVFTQKVSLNYHPLTILSLRLNNNECKSCPEGISAVPFIRGNVIIHLLNTLLVFFLIYLLSKKKILVAFLVAALFGVHPMHVESVAWVSERKDVLYSFFFLSGLITYIMYLRAQENKRRQYFWLAATFLLFLLSCLSKAMAVVFPLVLILIKFWFFQPGGNIQVKESIKEIFTKNSLIPIIPFFAVSLFFGFLAISINNLNSFTIWHRVQYASYGFIMYIIKFFVPGNQVAIYPYPAQTGFSSGNFDLFLKLSPFVFIAVAGLVIYSVRKTKLFLFGLGFSFITVMMVLQFISVGVAIMADRYTYLSYVGLAFIPAMVIGETAAKKKIPLYILSGCFIILMMILSQKQIKVWRNSDTLWTNVIDKYPNMETPRSLRGIYFAKKADRVKTAAENKVFEDKAFEDYKIAIKMGTARADVFESAGCIYGKRGDFKNALICLDKAIQLKPRKGSAYFNRGITLGMTGRNEEAINDYNMALIYYPQKANQIITNRSNLFLLTGRYREAIADFDYLISVDSKNFLFYFNRAVCRQQTKDIQGAISDYQNALRLQPDDRMSRQQLQMLTR